MSILQANAPCGELVVHACAMENRPSFFDYLRGGMELQFLCAIDFTASNGDPTTRDSLHFIDPSGELNEYANVSAAAYIILRRV